MKKRLFYYLLCYLISLPVLSQKYYSTAIHWTDLQQAHDILQKDNGNYLMQLSFKSFDSDRWKIGILETDTLGTIQFMVDTTPEDSIGIYRELIKVGTNYLSVGGVSLEPTLPWKIIVTKFQEDYTYTNYLYGNGIRSQDSYTCGIIDSINMLVGGHIVNITANGRNPYLVKLNSATGEQLWDTMYSFQQHTVNTISSVVTTPDGGAYLLATVNDNSENSDIALIQIDSMGVWLWSTIMNLTPTTWLSLDYSSRLIRTHDGGLVFGAQRYSVEGAYGDIFKIGADHTQVWHNTDNFLESVASDMVELSDSTLVFGGSSFATPTTTFIDGEICKLDKDGHTLWRRRYGQSHDDDYFYDLIVNNHDPSGKSGYVLCGRTESYAPAGKAYLYLVKTNCMGLLTEPQAAFSATMDTAALTASFQNLSEFVYPDSIDGGHFIWEFGDGAVSSEINPTHTYAQEGIYLAKLTAVVCNDTSTTYQSVCIGETPPSVIPNFTYIVQNDSLVTFTNTSSNATDAVFTWDFGDGTVPQIQTNSNTTVEHTYATADKYFVTLTAVLCSDTNRVQIKVNMLALGVAPSIDLSENGEMFVVYPNPAQDHLVVENHSLEKSATFVLYDVLGRQVLSVISHNQSVVSVEHLPSGVYLYQFLNPQKNVLQQAKVSVFR